MIDSIIIIGIIATITAILKLSFSYFQTEVGLLYISLIMLFLTGALNIVNGIMFDDYTDLTKALVAGYFKNGIIWGASASGIASMGENIASAAKNSVNKYRLRKGLK